jgi:hypothetical protein
MDGYNTKPDPTYVNAFIDSLLKGTTPPPDPPETKRPPMIGPTEEEYTLLVKKSVLRVLSKTLDVHHMQRLQDDPILFLQEMGTENPDRAAQPMLAITQRQREGNSTHVFITINPRPDVTLHQLMEKISKVLKKKWLTDQPYLYAIEQRSEDTTNMGEGIHAHMVIPKATEPRRIRDQVYNTLKDIVGTPKHVDFIFRTEDKIKGVITYIKGTKVSKDKMRKVEIDKIWRERQGLQPYYEHGSLLTIKPSEPTIEELE